MILTYLVNGSLVCLAAPKLGCKPHITSLFLKLISLAYRKMMLGTVFICMLIRGEVESPDLVG